jgi:hypothetical protein
VTWRLIVEAQAEAEILETAAWYGRRRTAVRQAFLDAVTAALAAIETNPLQYQIVRGHGATRTGWSVSHRFVVFGGRR